MSKPRIHTCSEPGCGRPIKAHGLCRAHAERRANGSTLTGPIQQAVVLTDEPHTACPNPLVPLVAQVAEFDARAIVRTIWPHLLEAHMAGLPPFTPPGPRP